MGKINGHMAPAFLFRHAIETEIERLIALLDSLDDNPDREPDCDDEPDADGEPWLGWMTSPATGAVSVGGTDDLEEQMEEF